MNLITNAYQAMSPLEDSGKVLRISASPESANGTRGAGNVIEDTGPGVPAEIREQIFNPFFTSKKDGVGLGLSIVAKIVDEHRGCRSSSRTTRARALASMFFCPRSLDPIRLPLPQLQPERRRKKFIHQQNGRRRLHFIDFPAKIRSTAVDKGTVVVAAISSSSTAPRISRSSSHSTT